MGAASYWSKMQDNKRHKEISNQKGIEKENTSIEIASDHQPNLKRAGINLGKKPVGKPLNIIQELKKINAIHEVFVKQTKGFGRLKAERETEKNEGNHIHLPVSLYESFKHKVSLITGTKLAWITGISLRAIFNYTSRRFKAKRKRNNSTAVTLWKLNENVPDAEQKSIQSITVPSRESKISRYETKVQAKSKLSLPTFEMGESPLFLKERVMIDLFLFNYIIQQRLNELVWMGISYSMVLATSNLNQNSSVDNALSRLSHTPF
ncbi:hypothetical protein MOSE0_N15830 [Monosporozyma servazzii]